MNEFAGDLVHDSCGMNDGKMINMAPMSPTSGWVPGPHGAALAFDGSDDYVGISRGFNDTNFFVICWVYPTSITTDQYVWGATSDKRVVVLGYTDNYFNIYNAGYPTGNADGTKILATVNQWQQVVYGSEGSRVYGYKNGTQLINVAANLNTSGITESFIGNNFIPTSTIKLRGLISSVSIYNRALSAEEIAYLYAFPWCMYDRAAGAWEYWQQNRNFDHYYRRLMAA